MIKNWIDALLETRWGRLVWVLLVVVLIAALFAAGTWIAILIGPPTLTGFDWVMAAICGLFIGLFLFIVIGSSVYFISILVDWVWRG